MKPKKTGGLIMVLCGCICLGGALFVYFLGHEVIPDASSSRVKDLNYLLMALGKWGTAILFAIPGFICLFAGLSRFK